MAHEDHLPAYKIVYSLYQHESLRYLVGAYAVRLLPSGELSFEYKALTIENSKEFAAFQSPIDHILIPLCQEIHPKTVIKVFGGDARRPVEFFQEKFSGKQPKIEETILNYIQKRLIQIFPLLVGQPFYEEAHDGYPARKPVKVLQEKATAVFHFKRDSAKTTYYITLRLREEKLIFTNKRAHILCNQPAWIWMRGEVFSFEDGIEGKKMHPFLTKMNIEIPKNKEKEYFEKFVTQIVEKYKVESDGFRVRQVLTEPSFHLYIRFDELAGFSFERRIRYDRHEFSFHESHELSPLKVVLEEQDAQYTFYKIFRNTEKEQTIQSLFNTIVPNPHSFLAWENLSKEEGWNWLQQNLDLLKKHNIEIHLSTELKKYQLEIPKLESNIVAEGDWFDVQAYVVVGQYKIPFIQFRNHILRHQREYVLPDGTTFILPASWFGQYNHLMKLADVQRTKMVVRKADWALLQEELQQLSNGKLLFEVEKEIPLTPLPVGLKAELRPYQQEGYDWLQYMKRNQRGAILADDMGLGKTLQALALLMYEKEQNVPQPSCIILPTSLVFNWLNEAKKFVPQLRICVHTGASRTKNAQSFDFFDVILTTYGVVRLDLEILKKYTFHYVILDESQAIKNPESKISQAVKQLNAAHRLSLTGTPIENSVMDIWSQMKFLNSELFERLFGSEAAFKRLYVQAIEKEKNVDRLHELRTLVQHFVKRRKKEQVATELPPKVENLHFCTMTERQEKAYSEVRDLYRSYLLEVLSQGMLNKNKLNVLTGLQKIRQLAIHPRLIESDFPIEESGKYEEVKRLLQEILAEDSKVLIFSQFVRMLQLLKQDLEREKIAFCYLDGSTSEKERKAQVESFQQDARQKVFLLSLKAGGVGLNLTAADYVFILDPWWNPAVEQQAIDRAHRIGQQKTVFYYKFITQNSIEEKIVKLQQHKKELSDQLIEQDEEMFTSFDEQDLRFILDAE